MRYIHGKRKAKRGTKIKVGISTPTRILIMTAREYKKYKENISYTYYGGHKEDGYEFEVPKTDEWHIVVEKGTYAAPIDVSATVELTHPIKQARPKPRRISSSIGHADEQMDAAEAEANAEVEKAEENEEEKE